MRIGDLNLEANAKPQQVKTATGRGEYPTHENRRSQSRITQFVVLLLTPLARASIRLALTRRLRDGSRSENL